MSLPPPSARPSSTTIFAKVAPPLPVEGLFTYSVPDELAAQVVPGVRVLVPFGARRLSAMCVGVETQAPEGVRLRPIVKLLEDEPLVGADILELGRWVARHTGCSLGEALDATLPRAVKTGSRLRTVEEARLVPDPLSLPPVVEELQAKRPKQARALRILGDRGGALPVRELMGMAHVSRSPIDSLVKAGYVSLRRVPVSHDPLGEWVARTEPLQLTDQQRAVYDRISTTVDAREARTFLLHGITGSGKTEVYLQVLARVVEQGRQGIVLVPEISLTPQTVRRFRERFERVAVLHSHLTDAERHDQWRAIRRGDADVVVGARSAVFAPVPDLGLIVVDEEHETSFKQQNVPRYHARDAAVERCALTGAVTILGTATPSLEAWCRALDDSPGGAVELGATAASTSGADRWQYERLVLSERVGGGRTPEIVMVDLTVEERRGGVSFLTDPLRAAMDDALARGGQVMLFLNRRGWAQVMVCRTCRGSIKCPSCDVSLTVHKRIGRVLCHYCGHEEPVLRTCPTCGRAVAPLGFGTEKVEQEVRQSFLSASVSRMDSDTMSGRGAHASVLSEFAEGRSQVLIGTQMIAKGLDFPNVVLVGVICADSALFLPDYRASERTFQLLAQVVGRTGRGPKGGRVVVQAYDPRHFSIRLGVNQDYEAFARTELELRRDASYPPFVRLVRVVVHGETDAMAHDRAVALADVARALAQGERPGDAGSGALDFPAPALGAAGPDVLDLDVLGPAPAPISRINKQYRHHIVCKCGNDASVEALLRGLAGHTTPSRGVRVIVDVDPLAMM